MLRFMLRSRAFFPGVGEDLLRNFGIFLYATESGAEDTIAVIHLANSKLLLYVIC